MLPFMVVPFLKAVSVVTLKKVAAEAAVGAVASAVTKSAYNHVTGKSAKARRREELLRELEALEE